MALKQDFNFKGITLNYWAITQVAWIKINNQTTVNISVYKDATSRDESACNFIPESTQTFYYNGFFTIAELYAKIKQESHFETAIDC